jgi:hypothetical protein
MQCFGGIIAELTNIFMLSTRETVEYCITFFVAFHVLTEIDNIYAEGLGDLPMKEAVDKHPLIFNDERPKFSDRNWHNKVVRAFFLVLNFWFQTFYYYFMPFIVNFIPYARPGSNVVGAH